ncbi:MAG: aminotransferase class V-fold PLP-dependent enzyme [Candidatus Latescibacterota bacterium]|nr:MAG: aminotransferase class V-fold PLP-dependent enzyme [Candidatus Latescibacterota bacterium]
MKKETTEVRPSPPVAEGAPFSISIEDLRREIIGDGFRFRTPFGERLMVYADYTASGRGVGFIERYLTRIQESYANTHTEDDETGRSTTDMLHAAERTIKLAVRGDHTTCIIAAGTGCTGAIQKLQEILGVYIPPATREWLEKKASQYSSEIGSTTTGFLEFLGETRPVVFVGPYEHHSNEVSWRESLAEIVEIAIDKDGGLDLADLEARVSDPRYENSLKIGSFSAASNVTGIRTPVYDVARILHRHGALACFDFAASAPYVEIDMNEGPETYFDAIYLSPHKFLGGPGSSGILLFNSRIYPLHLPPTFGAGGTVDYVGRIGHDYTADIEAREKPGTPGTLQILKAALAIDLKRAVGVEEIERRENEFVRRFTERFRGASKIEILGDPRPGTHIAIFSFNIRHGELYLHPKFVTRLFNDLFGIQSRAGCSCAGPYGHHLLGIDDELSERYRCQINAGYLGIKPGWVRIGFHYTMDEIDFDYVCAALEFLAEHGARFLPLYRFSLKTGTWSHVDDPPKGASPFGLGEALAATHRESAPLSPESRRAEYARYLEEAAAYARSASPDDAPSARAALPGEIGELTFFPVVHFE